jgi:hypothetical protein
LRIAALTPELGIEFDFDVRCDAVVLHLPFALRGPKGEVRRGHAAVSTSPCWVMAFASAKNRNWMEGYSSAHFACRN